MADPREGVWSRPEPIPLRAVVGYPTDGDPDARGGPVSQVCNRVPSYGRTGPTKGKQTSLESLGRAMVSLRKAE